MKDFRFKALTDAQSKKSVAVEVPGRVIADYYGQNVFGRRQMVRYISADTFKALINMRFFSLISLNYCG